MTAPNIEMIAASLRNCSLGRGNRGASSSSSSPPPSPSSPPPPRPLVDEPEEEEEEEEEGAGVTVELNSELPLPYQWEQCLDMRTGEIYYVNWENGTRTTEDPRTSSASYLPSYYSEEEEDEDTSNDDSTSGDGGDDGDGEDSGEPSFSSGAHSGISSVSSPSPGETATSAAEPSTGGGSGEILVAAGCKACFMYFMVPKRVEDCPKCGGLLLHLGRNGCI